MQLVTSADDCYVEDLNSTNGVYLNGKRVRRHKLQPGDVIKLGMHEITYSRVEPGDDARATQTTVLQDADYDDSALDAEADAETDAEMDEDMDAEADAEVAAESDADDKDGSPYSSIARGS
jgi:pSer/pThr/pTyr-binding forkhead associated (FHA) protein